MTAPDTLVTLGLTDRQRALLADVEATHVLVDLRSEKTPDEYLLDVVDASAEVPDGAPVLLLFGPLAFGFACSGQMRTLGVWADTREEFTLALAPDPDDPDTWLMASEAYQRVRADLGVQLSHPDGAAWLLRRLGHTPKETPDA